MSDNSESHKFKIGDTVQLKGYKYLYAIVGYDKVGYLTEVGRLSYDMEPNLTKIY